MARGGGGGAREDVDTSYLDMWKKAVESERKSMQFKTIAERVASTRHHGTVEDDLEKKTTEFHKLLEVPSEERDRVQRMQVIDRAAAAIAAARALIQQRGTTDSGTDADADVDVDSDERQRGTTESPVSISFFSFFQSFMLSLNNHSIIKNQNMKVSNILLFVIKFWLHFLFLSVLIIMEYGNKEINASVALRLHGL